MNTKNGKSSRGIKIQNYEKRTKEKNQIQYIVPSFFVCWRKCRKTFNLKCMA